MKSRSVFIFPHSFLSSIAMDDNLKIEINCIRLSTAFYRALDENLDRKVLAYFSANGIWHRAGKPVKAGEELATALNKRSATRRVRHVLTNVMVDCESTVNAKVFAYLTVYESDSGVAVQGPMDMPTPKMLGRIEMALAQEVGEWKITELRTLPDFTKPEV